MRIFSTSIAATGAVQIRLQYFQKKDHYKITIMIAITMVMMMTTVVEVVSAAIIEVVIVAGVVLMIKMTIMI